MGTLDLYGEKAKRKGRTLLEKLGGLAGADRSRTLPADASARYKRLLNGRLSAKHSR